MPTHSRLPGRQLHSVALRYRQPCYWQERSSQCWADRVWPPLARRPGATPAGAVCGWVCGGPPDRSSLGNTGAGGPLRRDARAARLEAVLFLAGEPLSSRKLGQLAGLADGTEARTLIRQLNDLYQRGGSAFRAEEVAGGFQLLTRPKFAGWLRRLHQSPPGTRLSGPAMETLAVVAYRQPVLRAMGLFEHEDHPNAERLGERGFYLPSGAGLSDEQVARAAEGLREILS